MLNQKEIIEMLNEEEFTVHTPTPAEMKAFVEYCTEFYEEGKGIYAKDFTPKVSRQEIEAAAILIVTTQEVRGIEFVGDSADREHLRGVLEHVRRWNNITGICTTVDKI